MPEPVKAVVTARGFAKATVDPKTKKKTSARIMINCTVTQHIVVAAFVNSVAEAKALLPAFKKGNAIEVVQKVTDDGIFWNLANADMDDKAILEGIDSEPIEKEAKAKKKQPFGDTEKE